jgi:hypothetical protein
MRIDLPGDGSAWIVIGPWAGRLNWVRTASFGWMEDDGPITRFIRRWWSGWHRWDQW